MQTSMS